MTQVQKLTRSREDKVIAGVCGGLGKYLEVDPLLFRIAFALLGVFGGGGIIAYLIFWLFVPYEGQDENATQEDIMKENAEDIKNHINKFSEKVERSNKSFLPGLIFLTVGILLVLTNMRVLGPGMVIPGVLVVMGIYLIFK